MFKKVFPQVLIWTGLAVLSGGGGAGAHAQDPAPAAAAGQRSDGQIEMDVVHALDASKALKKDLITAATIQGEVTLSGTVSSEASSELAEAIAGRVDGVTKVNNNLKIGNPQDAQIAQPAQPAPPVEPGDPGAQQAAAGQPNDGTDGSDGPAPPPVAYPQQVPQPDQSQAQAPAPAPYPQQYPPQQYPQQYPPTRPQYSPYPPQQQQGYSQPAAPAYETPSGPVTIPQGTLLQLRTSESLTSKRAKDGEPVQFTVIQDVSYGGVLAIPRGATVHGVVSEVKKVGSGDLGGSSELALKLTALDLGGHTYDLDTDQFKVKGPNKAGQTVGSAIGGGIVGTIIGCAVGRGEGCAIGAGAGLAAGTAASAASSGPQVWIPAEALVTFHLNTPLTVTPVSTQEAARLAQGLSSGPSSPTLYRRGYYPNGQPYYYLPQVYYRPYYMADGYYYWR